MAEEFPELLREFNRCCSESLLKLLAAGSRDDRKALRATAHSLKGAALNLYAVSLANHCAFLESIADSADSDQIEDAIAQMHDEVGAAREAISRWYAGL